MGGCPRTPRPRVSGWVSVVGASPSIRRACRDSGSVGVYERVNRITEAEEQADADEALALELYPALRRLAAVIAPAEVGPDDLLQESLAAVLRQGSLSALDDPVAYVARAMLNHAANHRRRFARTRRMLVRSRGGVVAAALDAYPSDLSDLQSLTPTARAVLFLRHVDGWSFDMIGAQLDLPAATARQIATRAHRQLRVQIEES